MRNQCFAENLAKKPGVQRYPDTAIDLFMSKNFLDQDECEQLIKLIEQNHRPSTIANPNDDQFFRTSETCDLDNGTPIVAQVNNKLSEFSGIDPAFGEPLQGQRYAPGQEFKAHTDFFDPLSAEYERYCAIAGQRSWTFMVYLNEPAAGGATRFINFKKIFRPQKAMLLCWNNMLPSGAPNYQTLHHGMKVRKGIKYIITKWYRQKPWG